MRPITIAGGGLAGLSLAHGLLRRGIPVTLHEAGDFPRHRVCGEYISGVRDEALSRLGILEHFDASVRQQDSAWFQGNRLILRRRLPTAARGISRHLLDHRLAEGVRDLGGVLKTHSRLPRQQTEGVVWTSGRRPARGSVWIGLKCHARELPLLADLEMHVAPGGYIGLARIEDERVNVCGLFLVDRRLSGLEVLHAYLEKLGLTDLNQRLKSAEIDQASHAAVAGFQLGWQSPSNSLFALGDALVMIPPFTGNGMSMALESADVALDPLEGYARGDIPWTTAWATTLNQLRRKFARRLFLARHLHPFLTSARGQACFATSARCGLVPIGLLFKLLR